MNPDFQIPQEEDARIILFSFLLTAYFAISFSTSYLLLFTVIFLCYYFFKTREKKLSTKPIYYLFVFCTLWFFAIFFVKSITWENGFSLVFEEGNLLFSFAYVARMFLLGLLGISTFISASAKEYAQALVWFFSFISKKNAWKVGLITLLVLKSFGDILKLAQSFKKSVMYQLRNERKISKKIKIYLLGLLRILNKRNYTLSIALFSRGLNTEKSFKKVWKPIISKDNLKKYYYFILLNLFAFSIVWLN